MSKPYKRNMILILISVLFSYLLWLIFLSGKYRQLSTKYYTLSRDGSQFRAVVKGVTSRNLWLDHNGEIEDSTGLTENNKGRITQDLLSNRSTYFDYLYKKYKFASKNPWISLKPDPPVPSF